MNSWPFRALLPISAGGLIAGLPVFLIARDYFLIEETRLATGSFIGVWILLGTVGGMGRRTALLLKPTVFFSFLGFLGVYYINWAVWPKGTELDELMWAYSVAYAIAPFAFGSLFEWRDLRIFLVTATAWGIVLAVLVLTGYIASGEIRYDVGRFTIAESLNPISQSLVIGFAILLVYAQALARARYYLFSVIPILLFAMLLGGSRGPAIALLAALGLMTLLTRKASRKVLAIVVMGLIFSGAVLSLPDLLDERYFTRERWLTTQTEEGLPMRVERATLAVERWLEYPILGSGTSGNESIFYSHNLVTQLLMETGIVGLGLFFAVLMPPLFDFLRRSRGKNQVNWEVLGFKGFLIYSLVEAQVAGTFMVLNFLWLSMGILIAWRRMDAQRQSAGVSRETLLRLRELRT